MAHNILLITFGKNATIKGTKTRPSLMNRLLAAGFMVEHKARPDVEIPDRIGPKHEVHLAAFDRILVYCASTPVGEKGLQSFYNWLYTLADHQKEGSRLWVFCFAPQGDEEKLDNYAGISYLPTNYISWGNEEIWQDIIRWLNDPWHGHGEKPDYTE